MTAKLKRITKKEVNKPKQNASSLMHHLGHPLALGLSVLLTIVLGITHRASQSETLVSSFNRINNPDGEFIRPLLVPRVPGTTSHQRVQSQLAAWFTGLGWHVQAHEFIANTPRGPTSMTNLVFTKNPRAAKRIVIAAHYDSKIRAMDSNVEGVFIGATDSALPCALIVELCHGIDRMLTNDNTNLTLQAVFFDGEEAFEHWTNNDSLYGSRQLAALWNAGGDDARPHGVSGARPFDLQNMQLFILLDLLGAARPRIPMYSSVTESHFRKLMAIEQELTSAGAIHKDSSTTGLAYFHHINNPGDGVFILDDHAPFHRLGYRDILHLIPSPFPSVWHRMTDNESALDAATINDLALILQKFLHCLFG